MNPHWTEELAVRHTAPAVVVFSGGQDSTTCLLQARRNHEEVYALFFDYGQRHVIEHVSARLICEQLDVPLNVVKLDFLTGLVTSALLGTGSVSAPHAHKAGLPASFVPNRNALFLTIAHAYAQEVGATHIYTGVCQTDYSGYPDCRLDFIKKLEAALNEGYQTSITIVTPLMFLNKAQTFTLAHELNGLSIILDMTHTCYNGNHETEHAWGFGCGECPACVLRAKGYHEFIDELEGRS